MLEFTSIFTIIYLISLRVSEGHLGLLKTGGLYRGRITKFDGQNFVKGDVVLQTEALIIKERLCPQYHKILILLQKCQLNVQWIFILSKIAVTLSKVTRVDWLGNLITFFIICFCSPFPY